MVKFAFLLHTIYKCLCVAALESSEWSWCNFGPILSCTGRRTCQRVLSWQRRQRNKVSWKFVTLRGLAASASSVCEKIIPSRANKNRKTTESGTLFIYCIYFVHLYIDWFIQIDSFAVFVPSCWLGRILTMSKNDGQQCCQITDHVAFFFFFFLHF